MTTTASSRRRASIAGAVCGGLLLASSAGAQTRSQADFPRTDPAREDLQTVDQITTASPLARATGGAQVNAGPRSVAPPAQLSPLGAQTTPATQLTGERGGRPVTQLNREARTVAGVRPLSTPGEGRIGAIAQPQGERDVCDDGPAADRRAVCDRVIETRAAEFPTRSRRPELSPEQRLLASGVPPEAAMADARVAARRLANGEPDDSVAAQAIAVAANQQPERAEPEPTADVAGDAVQALLEALAGGTTLTLPPGAVVR